MHNLESHNVLEVLMGGDGILMRTDDNKYLYLKIKDSELLSKFKGVLVPLSALLPGVDHE